MTKSFQKKPADVNLHEVKSSNDEDLKFNSRMKNLLFNHDETMEDKIATVKTARMVDKGRFEIAFKTLMKR